MKRIVLRDRTVIPPFGEPARELRILNKRLWVLHDTLLRNYCRGAAEEANSLADIRTKAEADHEPFQELLVYRDNLYFNQALIDTFIEQARATGRACQIAFAKTDKAIVKHALPLQDGIHLDALSQVFIADLYYFPHGANETPQPLVIDTQPREMGYYRIPSYMAHQGDLVFQIPLRVFLSIENWVHVFLANSPFGVFAMGRAHEDLMERARLKNILRWRHDDWSALWQKLGFIGTTWRDKYNPFAPAWRNTFFANSKLVKVGKNCSIDPTAIIHGPTIIGDDVTIGAGVTITNSVIGNNVTIMQGSHVMLSVVSDKCYLAFNSALFMSAFMENTIVAQLTCMQLCVVGRNTFIGAGNIFTDFNLWDKDWPDADDRAHDEERGSEKLDPREIIHTFHKGKLVDTSLPVLGCAIGHNCRIGSGFVFYPARMIGSNTTMIYSNPATAVTENVNVPPYGTEQATDMDESPRRSVYFWPKRYDPHHAQPQAPSADKAHDALHDPLEMSLFESASAGFKRRRR